MNTNPFKYKEQQEKKYNRIPEDFLKDIYIIPHNFINPDNPEHGEFVNEQMRNDLFNDTYAKIADIEMESLKNESDFLKLQSIKECYEKDDSLFDKLLTSQRKETTDEMIRCEHWDISISGKDTIQYKVKFYQSELDRFYALIFPPTMYKYYKLFQTNKSFI